MVEADGELRRVEEELSSTVYQDERTWARMLAVVVELLESTHKNLKHPGLHGLLNTTILPVRPLSLLLAFLCFVLLLFHSFVFPLQHTQTHTHTHAHTHTHCVRVCSTSAVSS